jgi:hypothetical protein
MRTIDVAAPVGVMCGFPTIIDAVAHGSSCQAVDAVQLRLVCDKRILSGKWTDRELALMLDGQVCLRIFLDGTAVNWSASSSSVASQQFKVFGSESSPVCLRYGNGESTVWDRRRLIQERIGKRIRRVFINESWLFLYTDNAPILLFLALGMADGGLPFLKWDETD